MHVLGNPYFATFFQPDTIYKNSIHRSQNRQLGCIQLVSIKGAIAIRTRAKEANGIRKDENRNARSTSR